MMVPEFHLWQSMLAKQPAEYNNEVYSWYHICDRSHWLANTRYSMVFEKAPLETQTHAYFI